MLDLGITKEGCPQIPQLTASLWHCYRCDAFVAIRASKFVEEPFCPACGEVSLDYCGSTSAIPGLSFGEA